jgi:uncharacterized protein YjeT (DUF2065 family)
MPKANLHWAHDLLAAAVVIVISGLVFWLVPPAAHAASTSAFATEHDACTAAIS